MFFYILGCGVYLPQIHEYKTDAYVNEDFQVISVDRNFRSQIIICYLSSRCDFSAVVSVLRMMIKDETNVCITGDFNFIPSEKNDLSSYLQKIGLIQLVDSPTHKEGRTLDHVYVPQHLADTIDVKICCPYYSDHFSLCIKFNSI